MKKTIAFIITFIVAFSFVANVFANTQSTMSNNVNYTSTNFSISTSGKATVTNTYNGVSGITKSATITTKIQKKVGLIWVTVSGASWTDTSSSVNYSKSHTFQLSSTGTYRAHVKFVISGSGGSDDEITKNVEKTY